MRRRTGAGVGLIAVIALMAAACGGRLDGASPDPCLQKNGGCDSHAMCANNNGVSVCSCLSGYAGTGYYCVDVDECGDHTAYCDPNATCTNGPGSYTCACNPGWIGDGASCTPVDAGIPDAGSGLDDAGRPLDAGELPDAGETVDAGNAAPDAGPPTSDAGSPFDAGQATDSGPADAGPSPADAGGALDGGPPDAGDAPDAGARIDAGPPPYDAGPSTLANDTITGQIEIDPSELQWRGQLASWTPPVACVNGQASDGTAYDPDAGSLPSMPPCLAGSAIQMVDQIRQLEGDGSLGAGQTDWTGAYSVAHLDLVSTYLGVLAVVTDPSGLLAPSAGIVALPSFSAQGVTGTPAYVVSVAFMQHIAKIIGMSYESMMAQGVALIHVTGMPEGQTLFQLYGLQEPMLIPCWQTAQMFCPTASLSVLAGGSRFPPYAYYLSSDLNGVLDYTNGEAGTSSAGLVVVVAPLPLLSPPDGGTEEAAYTVNESGDETYAVFGDQPNTVVDVSIPSD